MKKLFLLVLALVGFTSHAQGVVLNNYCGDTSFDLTTTDGQVLGNQNPNDFTITYHLSQTDANLGANPIANPENFQVNASTMVFARAAHNFLIDHSVHPIELVVNTQLFVEITATLDFPTSTLMALPWGGQQPYLYTWSLDGQTIAGQNSESLLILNLGPGVYTVAVTDASGCSGVASINVNVPSTINANNDDFLFTNIDGGGITPPGVGTVLSNDNLNGLPVSLNTVSLSLVYTGNPNISLSPQGMVNVSQQTPSGTYTLVYRICELGTTNCDTATVTVTVDYCRAATPIIEAVTQPTCATQTGSIALSGLPETGIWTIQYIRNGIPQVITGSGTTFSLPNLSPGEYILNVTAQDILLANCYPSFNINFIIEDVFNFTGGMYGTYVDFNNDGYTNVGDIIHYDFTLTNNHCSDVTGVNIGAPLDISVSGGPIDMASGVTDSTTFTGTYVITQQDINNGSIENSTIVQGTLNDNYVLELLLSTVTLNLADGIKLNAFLDVNANGLQDNGEPNFPNGEFHYSVNNGATNNITTPNGVHYIYETNATNNYNISYTINPQYAAHYAVTPASYANITVAQNSGITTYNFAVTVTPYTDASVALTNVNAPPRPGFIYQNRIVYSNSGTQAIASGTVTFTHDPMLSITSISESGAVTNATGFTFDYTNLLPGQTRMIVVSMQVPTIPNVALGDLVTNSCAISLPTNDAHPENNSTSLTQTIVGSYDPNDKAESRGPEVVFSDFSANDYLTYTIRFENTGTASAVNVRVNDLLDSHLDESTVRTIASSHAYVLKRVGSALTWNFDGIDLPPSVDGDEITGHGYIVFQVKPKSGYALGDIIPNNASIYFDFNPAIVTNTWTTEFVPFLGVDAFDAATFEYYPNPTSSSVTFAVKDAVIDTIVLTDVLGKTLISKPIHDHHATMDMASLGNGVYFAKVTCGKQEKTIKLIKR